MVKVETFWEACKLTDLGNRPTALGRFGATQV